MEMHGVKLCRLLIKSLVISANCHLVLSGHVKQMGLEKECDIKCNSQSAMLPELAGLKLLK